MPRSNQQGDTAPVAVPHDQDDDLETLLAKVPEATSALTRIPRSAEFQGLLFGEPATYWDTRSDSDLTTKMYCAGLQLEVEALAARFTEVEQRYEASRAAERGWRPMLQARDAVVFRNDAGDVATMPVQLVRLIASKGTFDGNVVAKARTIQFVETPSKVIAEIPKTLFVSLEKILEPSLWGARSGASAGAPGTSRKR